MAIDRPVTIGVAERLLGIPAWKLRAWEKAGLLTTERTPSGYRLFSRRDLERAQSIAAELEGADRLAGLGLAHSTFSAGADHVDTRSGVRGEREVDVLRRLAHTARHAEDVRAVTDAGLEAALELTGSTVGALSSADFTRQQYVLLSSVGLSTRYTRGVDSWKLHEGLAGRSFGLREPLIIHDLQVDRHVAREFVRAEGLRGYLCVPLLRGQRRLGILEVFSRTAGRFASADVDALELVAALISPVLEVASLERRLGSVEEERSRSLREWSNQLSSGYDRARADIAARLRDIAAGFDDDMRPRAAARMIEHLADDLAATSSGAVDLAPLVKINVVRRLAEQHRVDIGFEASGWPTTLPSVLSSRLYLLILAIAEESAEAARTRVALSIAGTSGELSITIADDREARPGLGEPAVSATIEAAVRNLGGRLASRVTANGALVQTAISIPRGEHEARGDALTQREREVLESLRLGTTNRDIASELGISAKTLQNHLTALYRKLGVTSRAEAIRFAERMLEPPADRAR